MSDKSIPSLPALSSIKDDNVRIALQAFYDAWKVRNGDVGDGSNKFLTASDLVDGFKSINISGGSSGAFGGLDPDKAANYDSWVSTMLQTVDSYIQQSRLWRELSQELARIDTDIIGEQEARIAAIASEAAARLEFDTVTGSSIAAIIDVNSTQATQISGLTTRVGTAESTIVTLETTTANQAQSLVSLTTRVGATESSISTLNTTTANQANSLTLITAGYKATQLGLPLEQWVLGNQSIVQLTDGKVGASALRLSGNGSYPNQGNYIAIDPARKYRVRFWARPSSNAAGLLYFSLHQFTNNTGSVGPVNGGRSPYKPSGISRASHIATYGDTWGEYSFVWSASDWQSGVKYVQPEFLDNYPSAAGYWDIQGFSFSDVTDAESLSAAISSEATARANADSALTSTINTQVSTINGNIASLQTQYNTLATTTGTNSSAITSLQSSLNGVSGTASSALSLAQTTSGSVTGSWTVKFNANGYVVGAGLGLEGKGGSYTSTFGVIADRFFIARPDGTNPVPLLEMATVNGVNVLAFKGVIAGASGYFSGDLNASGGTFRGELQAATGTFSGSLSAGTVDVSKLIGATYRYESPGWYSVAVPAGYTSMRVTIIGGGGGGGSGAHGEWNIHGGGGGGGGAGQYRIYAWDGLAVGATISIYVGPGGAGATELFQSGAAGGPTDIYYNGAHWIRAEPGGGGGHAAYSGWVDHGYGEEPGGGGGGYPAGGAGHGPYGGNGANSQWGGVGGQGYANWYGGSASGFGAGGAGGGYDGGTGNYGGGSPAKYDGWFPGGAGAGGRAIIEFYNPNSVVLRTEFTTLQTRVTNIETSLNTVSGSYATTAWVNANFATISWVQQNFMGNCNCNCQCSC